MKDLIIIGAGGFGREVAWLTDRINKKEPTWNIVGFIDDNPEMTGVELNGYKVLGTTGDIKNYPDAYLVCAVGSSRVRKMIVERVKAENPQNKFAILIDPSVEMSDFVEIGDGSIICAHTIITVNIKIGENVIMNLNCTVGHDAVIGDYVTMYPDANVSGITTVGECTELGTGMQVIQGISIGSNTIVGAGAVVIRDIPDKCTAVGSPAKPIKFFD